MWDFVATADWHIPTKFQSGSWKDFPDICNDSIIALNFAVNLCLEHSIPLVAAGDLLDGPHPDVEQINLLLNVLKPLQNNNLPLIYITGNHDQYQDWLSLLGRSKHAHNVSESVFTHNGITYSGLSCVNNFEEFKNKVQNVLPTDVGLYHQGWKHLISRGDYDCNLLPHHKFCCLGDIHVIDIRQHEVSGTQLLSPGPLSPQNTTEFIDCSIHLVKLKPEVTVKSVKVPSRKFVNITCSEDASSVDEITNLLQNTVSDFNLGRLATPLIVVNWGYPGPYPEVWKEISSNNKIRLWVKRLETEEASVVTSKTLSKDDYSIEECVSKMLDNDTYSQFIANKVLHNAKIGKAHCKRFVDNELRELFIQEFFKNNGDT